MKDAGQHSALWLSTGSCLVVFTGRLWLWLLVSNTPEKRPSSSHPSEGSWCPWGPVDCDHQWGSVCLVAPLWICCFRPFTLYFWKEVDLLRSSLKSGSLYWVQLLSTLLRIFSQEDTVFCSLHTYICVDPEILLPWINTTLHYFSVFQDFIWNCFHELLCCPCVHVHTCIHTCAHAHTLSHTHHCG